MRIPRKLIDDIGLYSPLCLAAYVVMADESRPMTKHELAAKIRQMPAVTGALMDWLEGQGLIVRHGHGYKVAPVTDEGGGDEEKGSPKPGKAVTAKNPLADDVIAAWIEHFPNKPKPRGTGQQRQKINTRLKDKFWRENYRRALEISSRRKCLQDASWFTFDFFIRNESNINKMLDDWMKWKDEQDAQKSNGASLANGRVKLSSMTQDEAARIQAEQAARIEEKLKELS